MEFITVLFFVFTLGSELIILPVNNMSKSPQFWGDLCEFTRKRKNKRVNFIDLPQGF